MQDNLVNCCQGNKAAIDMAAMADDGCSGVIALSSTGNLKHDILNSLCSGYLSCRMTAMAIATNYLGLLTEGGKLVLEYAAILQDKYPEHRLFKMSCFRLPVDDRAMTPLQQKWVEKRKEKTTPFGVNLMRSQVLYRAAQRKAATVSGRSG